VTGATWGAADDLDAVWRSPVACHSKHIQWKMTRANTAKRYWCKKLLMC